MNMGLKVEHERTNMEQNVDTEINKCSDFSNFSIFLWNPFLHPTLSTSLFLYLLFYFLLSIPTALLRFLPLPLLLYLFSPLLQSFCLLSLLTSSSLLLFFATLTSDSLLPLFLSYLLCFSIFSFTSLPSPFLSYLYIPFLAPPLLLYVLLYLSCLVFSFSLSASPLLSLSSLILNLLNCQTVHSGL